ncbi:trypsin-like peptidase domain-containing protein [Argonema antarcticum]|uniref:trypsin-like peptidase domain-containing protein n=1 Tax=Argonema antarcticum TaxID=2942763 RepID=UPI002011C13D|nr:trypsin-like peptidase domain-containing protein [Argonema antarcticum]MCL1471868.1 trypsin-like peptidase domain-containing protein [Argonema antarcticum A004/B2]
MKFYSGLSAAIIGTAIVVMQPQFVVPQALDEQAIASLGKEITVVINGQNPGSGVIIGKKDNTYYVLTAKHVVATQDEYEILTPDGTKHALNYGTVKKLSGVDLALVQFTSSQNYRVAEIADSDTTTEGATVYTSGWPHPGRAITERIYQMTAGRISGRSRKPLEDGYALIYTNITRSGMSGGPVLDAQGRVVGIHGRAEGVPIVDPENGQTIDIKSGFNLAIPIKSFLEVSAITDTPPNSSLAPLLLAWGEKIHKENQIKIAADYYQKALLQDAKLGSASFFLGLAKYELGDVQGAISSWQTVDRNANYGKYVYRIQLMQLALAVATYGKGDRQGCLEIMNKLDKPHQYLIEVENLKKELWGDRLLADTKKMMPELFPSKTIETSSKVYAVAITTDGQTLATAHPDKTIKLWNVSTGELKTTLTGLSATLSALTISPDGQILAGGSSDSSIKLWNLRTGELKSTLTGHSAGIVSIVFSPDSQTLASAGDTTVKLWDVGKGQLQTTFTGDKTPVNSIAFSPDGQTLASVNGRGNINLWNVKTRQINSTINSRSGRRSIPMFLFVGFSADGQTLARRTGDNIEFLNIRTQQVITTIENNSPNYFASLLTNGKTMITQNFDNTFKFWDVTTGKLQRILYGNSYADNRQKMIAISSDGKTLASAYDKKIWIWHWPDR